MQLSPLLLEPPLLLGRAARSAEDDVKGAELWDPGRSGDEQLTRRRIFADALEGESRMDRDPARSEGCTSTKAHVGLADEGRLSPSPGA